MAGTTAVRPAGVLAATMHDGHVVKTTVQTATITAMPTAVETAAKMVVVRKSST